ncbi:MAG: ABC transporter substrate-binding protein [Desulfobacterales bacterium]|nr:MAG: ABC transporter substrate-binding protein [Desulfobacterales bacterium]
MRNIFAIIISGLVGMFSLPAIASEPIHIAAIFAKTGIAVKHNAPHVQMVELSIEEIINQGGFLGRPVKLIILDNKSSPIGSSIAARKAVQLQVPAVIGAAWSSHSLQIAPILQQAKIPMITGSSTNPKVTRIGNYIFRTCFIDSFQAQAMAQFAYIELGARRAIVLEIINEEFSLTLAELFSNSYQQYGGKVILKESYENDAVDFANLLKKVKTLHPDVVYVPGYARDSGLLIKQAASMGIQTTFLGGDGWAGSLIYDIGSNALEGNYYSAHWHHDVSFPQSIHMKKMYYQKYKSEIPSMNAPLTYDAVMLLADAIHRVGTFDRDRIRDALAETKGFQGATGTITFDEHGDPLNKPVVILKLGKDAPMYFKSIQP